MVIFFLNLKETNDPKCLLMYAIIYANKTGCGNGINMKKGSSLTRLKRCAKIRNTLFRESHKYN